MCQSVALLGPPGMPSLIVETLECNDRGDTGPSDFGGVEEPLGTITVKTLCLGLVLYSYNYCCSEDNYP